MRGGYRTPDISSYTVAIELGIDVREIRLGLEPKRRARRFARRLPIAGTPSNWIAVAGSSIGLFG